MSVQKHRIILGCHQILNSHKMVGVRQDRYIQNSIMAGISILSRLQAFVGIDLAGWKETSHCKNVSKFGGDFELFFWGGISP